jgi:asparagine synthase (glutamine-hydrolysing)
MCGIAGIWNYKTGRPVDREPLARMTGIIAHRGPDGEGYHWGRAIGLGHRRLSIIDLEGGHQPMCNEDGTIWIVFNGEIYNYPELRQELLQYGHQFRTKSDTEAILHLYEDYGEWCFQKLRGMFALALWDERNQKLLLARDRMGIKPLFYGVGKDGITFGSELKCIRESGQISLETDPAAIADLFTHFYIPGPKTIYRDALALEPGHFLLVSQRGIRKQKYWDLQDGTLELKREDEYEERLYELLRESVGCHLLSDVPVGAFLSGGVDSGAVVALMSQLVQQPVMTCSIGFEEKEYNELGAAATVAGLFRTDHREHIVKPEPAKVLADLVNFYDQPFPDHSAIPTYYVSRMARQRVKVALSGDGGDENFGGYRRYAQLLALERIRQRTPALALRPFQTFSGDRQGHSLFARAQRWMHQLSVGTRDAYLHGMTITDQAMRSRIFSKDFQELLADYDPLDSFRDIYNRAPGSDLLSKVFYLDLKTYLVDDILTKVDRASMANSLEVRVPLLDHRIVEFAYSLPLRMKLRGGKRKYLLRKVLSRHLPGDHLNLKKKGFSVPMVSWLRGDLKDWAGAILASESPCDLFLDRQGVRQVWDSFQSGDSHFVNMLSVLLAFKLSAPIWAGSINPSTRRLAAVGD